LALRSTPLAAAEQQRYAAKITRGGAIDISFVDVKAKLG